MIKSYMRGVKILVVLGSLVISTGGSFARESNAELTVRLMAWGSICGLNQETIDSVSLVLMAKENAENGGEAGIRKLKSIALSYYYKAPPTKEECLTFLHTLKVRHLAAMLDVLGAQ